MSMIVDVILIAVVLLVVYKAYQSGFVKTFLDTFSVFIAGIASFSLCRTVADAAYDMFIGDLVKTEFKRALDDLNRGSSLSEKLNAITEMELQEERESIIILAPADVSTRILEDVNEKYGLRSKARGILCAVPVEKAYKI